MTVIHRITWAFISKNLPHGREQKQCWRFEDLTFFNTEIGSVDKACKKEQVPYWGLNQIAHLCVAVYSMVCSLLSSYMLPELITHQAYSISELPGV